MLHTTLLPSCGICRVLPSFEVQLYFGVGEMLSLIGVEEMLSLSGVEEMLPLSGVEEMLPLSGVEEMLPPGVEEMLSPGVDDVLSFGEAVLLPSESLLFLVLTHRTLASSSFFGNLHIAQIFPH